MTTTAGWTFSLPMVASRSEAHGPPADSDMPSASSYFIAPGNLMKNKNEKSCALRLYGRQTSDDFDGQIAWRPARTLRAFENH